MNKNNKNVATKLIIVSDTDSEPSIKSTQKTSEDLTKESNIGSNEEISKESSLETFDEALDDEVNLGSCNTNLEPEFKKLNCNNENIYSNKCNKFLLKKEAIEKNCLAKNSEEISPSV